MRLNRGFLANCAGTKGISSALVFVPAAVAPLTSAWFAGSLAIAIDVSASNSVSQPSFVRTAGLKLSLQLRSKRFARSLFLVLGRFGS